MNDLERAYARHRLSRADESLKEATLMAESGHWNTCINRLYYACFYVVSALLLTEGYTSSKHSGIRALFGQHFLKPGRIAREHGMLYNKLFEQRQESDYSDLFQADPDVAKQLMDNAQRLVAELSVHVERALDNET